MRSRTRSVSQPEQPPRCFLDRSLGRRAVPEALRADGWDLITLAEHYGTTADEQVAAHPGIWSPAGRSLLAAPVIVPHAPNVRPPGWKVAGNTRTLHPAA